LSCRPGAAAVALLAFVGVAPSASADPFACDLSAYRAGRGPAATLEGDALLVTWAGEADADLRLALTVRERQPVVRELAVRRTGGRWASLARDLAPEFRVTSGVRRMSNQQVDPLTKELGLQITSEVVEHEKWYAFWDAPLLVPGTRAGEQRPRNLDLPRKPEEIRRASASFDVRGCRVKTDGLRLEVTFPGLSLGIFAGDLRFTVYRGANLVRMEAVAKTEEPSVAYKYDAGLKGFSTTLLERLVWRDTGGEAQQQRFGGAVNDMPVAVRARNRILVAEGPGGSVSTFPPPHTFFFSREVETNLGYVWYRNDGGSRFGLGIRQAEQEEVEEYEQNFALYNAPPGTWQRMAVYFHLSPAAGDAARQSVLALTHGDAFKPLPGYQTMVNHMHIRFTERLRDAGSLDAQTPDLLAIRALGIDIVGLSDFHGDLHPLDPGPLRFGDQKDYAAGAAKASDQGFLVLPWEESHYMFGGHYNMLLPRPAYWTAVRQPGQPFTEEDPAYGKVYHVRDAVDLQRFLDDENGYWFWAHQRTKGSTGFPDGAFDKPWARNDRNLGLSFKPGMGMDLSEKRLCEWRCFDALDTMNNRIAGSGLRPKYLIADIDTYRKAPQDDLYPHFPVTYVKLDTLPGPTADWGPIVAALRKGDFFVTTGEILVRDYAVEGTGSGRTVRADLEWTFPLEFIEVVWGDGQRVERQVIPATDLPAFGAKRFAIPFDATGRRWVRFAAWDSAGNGAFTQPVWLDGPGRR
jgi:hypothetical protein